MEWNEIKKDSSCPPNKCLNNGQCSMRLSGKFYCQCLPPSSGTQCEIGLFLRLFFFHCWSIFELG